MKKLISIGEALIDFIPDKKGCRLSEVEGFKRACGGAPCNVAAACAKLGGSSMMITQLGNDGFGDFIVNTLDCVGVDTSAIQRTDEANTSLAFVSLTAEGDREFSFYRKPGADMLLSPESIRQEWFSDTGVLHFCSVDLVDYPVKQAHKKAIEYAVNNGAIISFDPNIRLALWGDENACKSTVNEFIPYADILKISDEELEFITDMVDIQTASQKLFADNIRLKIILYSMGSEGASVITRRGRADVSGINVTVEDTTGAGDSVIGAFLYQLARDDVSSQQLENISLDILQDYLKYANYYSSLSVTRKGAISSYATAEELENFIEMTEGK